MNPFLALILCLQIKQFNLFLNMITTNHSTVIMWTYYKTVLTNHGMGPKIVAICIRGSYQSVSFGKLPHFDVNNIFLAQ